MEYLDIQVSIDGATAATSDPVRGAGSFAAAGRAMGRLAEAGFGRFKVSVVVTRHNAGELDALLALADSFGAELQADPPPAGRPGRERLERASADGRPSYAMCTPSSPSTLRCSRVTPSSTSARSATSRSPA